MTPPPPLPSPPPPPPPTFTPPRPPRDPVAAQVRGNLTYAAVFLLLTLAILWATHRHGGAEIVNQAGALILVLVDAIAFIAITWEAVREFRRGTRQSGGTQ